ncbi:hypothetical protein D3C83_88200 [compost metagenome]
MPVFQQCGTMVRPRALAMSQTILASPMPPTRPTSGCATCTLPISSNSSNSKRVASHSPYAIFIGAFSTSFAISRTLSDQSGVSRK